MTRDVIIQLACGLALVVVFFVLQSSEPLTVRENDALLEVSIDGGKQFYAYKKSSRTSITMHPIMRQRYFIGVADEAAASSQIYYITPSRLAQKRREYSGHGCFETYGPADMEQLLIVADKSNLARTIDFRTPQLNGGESTVTLTGHWLTPTNPINPAETRKFFYINEVSNVSRAVSGKLSS